MLQNHGMTKNTPKSYMFAGAVLYNGLKFGEHHETCLKEDEGALEVVESGATANQVNVAELVGCKATVGEYVVKTTGWYGTPYAATTDGIKLAIEEEIITPEIDGVIVEAEGAHIKMPGSATITGKVTEFQPHLLVDILHLTKDSAKNVTGYTAYKSKKVIGAEDYKDNFAVVGELIDGRKCIVIFPKAIIKNAFELEMKNKEQASYEIEVACVAPKNQTRFDHLPYELYFEDESPVVEG
jgi:hypothetical protein